MHVTIFHSLNSLHLPPLRFAFVQYVSEAHAQIAFSLLNNQLLDANPISLEFTPPVQNEKDPRRFGTRQRHASSDNWHEPAFNRHVIQALARPGGQHNSQPLGYSVAVRSIPFDRQLKPDAPQLKYRRRKGELKTVCHWGQRKLLLAEIEFLTMHSQPDVECTVLYAGAAPGSHMPYLCQLFPKLQFVCVDVTPFTCKPNPAVNIRRETFSKTLAAEYSDREIYPHVLFISDVRAADPDQMSEDQTDAQIRADMDNQMLWHKTINPDASMLKFRLSWQKGGTSYLQGDIQLPVWGPVTTTETRLIVSGGAATPMVDWQNQKYEQQMFHFNTHTRVALYEHPVASQHVAAEGLCHCYDCTAELYILKRYLVKFHLERDTQAFSDEELANELATMVGTVSRACSSKRTLLDDNPDPEERKRRGQLGAEGGAKKQRTEY